MKIGIVINGLRGDVQPMLALATELINRNHEIVFCAPPENEQLVKKYDCPFIAFGPNYKEIFKKKSNFKGGLTVGPSPKKGKIEIVNQIKLLPSILKGCDLILGVGFVLGVHSVAEYLKVPYRFVIFYPILLGTSKTDPLKNRMMFNFGRSVINLMIKGFINKKLAESGLTPIKDVWQNWLGDEVIVACDKEMNQVKEGVSFNYIQTGYMHLKPHNQLPENVDQFIRAGEPPVFVCFGSNPISEPEKFAGIFEIVSESTGQRLIISKGWADLPDHNSAEILYVDEMPYEYLFPKLSAIVFHGGTGTMAAAAKAGIPQIAFPFMADQFDNRKQILKLGLGPEACDFKKMTPGSMINAINECLQNADFKKNAVAISQKLLSSDGLKNTADLIEILI